MGENDERVEVNTLATEITTDDILPAISYSNDTITTADGVNGATSGGNDTNENVTDTILMSDEMGENDESVKVDTVATESTTDDIIQTISNINETTTTADGVNGATSGGNDTNGNVTAKSRKKRDIATEVDVVDFATYDVMPTPKETTKISGIISTVIAPVRLNPESCILQNENWLDDLSVSVQLVPRHALSVLATKIRHLNTRLIYEPACDSHFFTRDPSFAVNDMYAAETNAFAVREVKGGNRLFLFYGGKDVVERFEYLPQQEFLKDSDDSNRHDLFSVAIYLPFNYDPWAGTSCFLPIATRHSRMLFVLSSDETPNGTYHWPSCEKSVLGTAQMWFRNIDDMKIEFGRLQRLLCMKQFVRDHASVVIAFTIEIPTIELRGKPTTLVEGVWKQLLDESSLHSRIPVVMFIDHLEGFYRNEDFDSATVHGYFLDDETFARVTSGKVNLRNWVPDMITCNVRFQYLVDSLPVAEQ